MGWVASKGKAQAVWDVPKDLKREWFEAATRGSSDDLKKIVERRPDIVNLIDDKGETGLFKVAREGHREAVQTLVGSLRATTDLSTRDGFTPLMISSCRGDVEVSKLLLDARASVNVKDKEGRSALTYAVGQGHAEMVALLIANRAKVHEPTGSGHTPLM
uniref:Uncharacterized protein n=1 Tax=Chromera velia CCMP2878 TaxID=1169474 RepID=A0A0G4G363_9ALVE|eukprot:Cvel_4093.t1-p1 / transcript=Cvel_4093.t1 / gene=Cvel_4093 / organism=Chromera_velia_CCMP2878 / gene_product=Ankyrin-1, putative / transcript_product=Ankyrin-1, putative / location=Cvel_scaffold174:56922-58075(-) / protein_length=159 / sequence_SO=supercontig / SO=protein_coding / is_pseudo=false